VPDDTTNVNANENDREIPDAALRRKIKEARSTCGLRVVRRTVITTSLVRAERTDGDGQSRTGAAIRFRNRKNPVNRHLIIVIREYPNEE